MDIRRAFLDFFASKGHKIYESAPLVPDDATLLFTNAGMVPFKTVFTGEVPVPNPPRAASCQTCIRAGGKHNDLENVGHTARHHTFFEMLGNFSFGDYFKEDAIAYAWEFVTEVLELPVEKLWVTVHESDDEAAEIWAKYVAPDRILRMGDKDNFWQMGDTGPCGPCSEIFYDQGQEHFNGPEDYMGGDGDRFLEIWNLVFMQYERDKDGNLTPLPKPSIDTGMGLERVMAVKEGKLSNYDTELFMPIIRAVEKMVGKPYVYESGASYRVIADHLRSTTFLLAQSVNFSNEGRGYVLRRILRRAVRHGYMLGLREPFMCKLVDVLVEIMGGHYTYLVEKKETVKQLMQLEEERFFATIAAGIELFEKELANTKNLFSGSVAFKLYDTYGFPLDLTQDMLKDRGIDVDIAEFERLMQEQRQRAKAAWKGSGDAKVEGDFKALIEEFGKNSFVGYESLTSESKVVALLNDSFERVEFLEPEQTGWVMLDTTPFYAESGGQAGDVGVLQRKEDEQTVAEVLDTKKFFDLNLSKIKAVTKVCEKDLVKAVVDTSRHEIAKHHSATHLLHSALREILGDHVSQAGSLVEADRLRFDFSHPKALSAEEIASVEKWVNDKVERGIDGETEEMDIESAKAKGAMALFGEKYGDKVRVVSFGDSSIELCGGTHVRNTAEIGMFLITKESGVSAGVRRIEAVCGHSAYEVVKNMRGTLAKVESELKAKDPILGIEKLKSQIKQLKQELVEAQKSKKSDVKAETINGVTVVVDEVEGGDIKSMIDDLKNAHDKVAVMLFQRKGEKVLIAAGQKNTSVKAGAWVKQIAPILGGGGGGRDDFAQAGGKDASKIGEAKEKAMAYLKENL
ncbi:alanine--tRNA ligase [Hydrogenimonas thermophila]|uniref:alanine--tRNA ligase n=1 Tax=Hydrogenimonas thermophila TaxID=223786 RepID=UPI00293735C0|nr:alanine--tRNA ligase [Hydrogenimonas thermophila]WOE69575.1 alanine--tRNA ligase [Hydrogenimonas thermophila]WOE72089.1 alanine--tRNA ligase [Hydrogenimonas thermophila]